MSETSATRAGIVAVLGLFFGCNTLIGLELGEPADDDSTSGATAGGATAGNGGSAATGNPDPLGDAVGVDITEIALYQGVKRPLMANGAAVTSGIPIVAGRDALIRVFAVVQDGYDGGPVVARLYLGGLAQPYEAEGTVDSPTEDILSSTFNFDVPGADIGNGFSYRVELKQAGSPTAVYPGAGFPAAGFEGAEVRSAGAALKIKLVPVIYEADGSSRMPDTSPAQIQAFEDQFYGMYPVPAVEISLRAPMSWNQVVFADGGGWSDLLNAIADVRADEAAPDVYYYGIFAPAASVAEYCASGCPTGLGFQGAPADPNTRAAIGLGFSGALAPETAVHEVGHNHGRSHAPCGGPPNTDPDYPYPTAGIGSWGYNLLTGQLYSPSGYFDLMSFCQPVWVSDYTYNGLFNHIAAVNGANIVYPPELLNRTYDRVSITPNGELSWMNPIQLATPPMGEEQSVVLTSEAGAETVTGWFYGYDHLDGGVVLWPATPQPLQRVQVELGGKVKSLTR